MDEKKSDLRRGHSRPGKPKEMTRDATRLRQGTCRENEERHHADAIQPNRYLLRDEANVAFTAQNVAADVNDDSGVKRESTHPERKRQEHDVAVQQSFHRAIETAQRGGFNLSCSNIRQRAEQRLHFLVGLRGIGECLDNFFAQ